MLPRNTVILTLLERARGARSSSDDLRSEAGKEKKTKKALIDSSLIRASWMYTNKEITERLIGKE